MRRYSIAKVTGDFAGIASILSDIRDIKAHNYTEAVQKAIVYLHLKKGDTLSIVALEGSKPRDTALGLPGRYEYKI